MRGLTLEDGKVERIRKGRSQGEGIKGWGNYDCCRFMCLRFPYVRVGFRFSCVDFFWVQSYLLYSTKMFMGIQLKFGGFRSHTWRPKPSPKACLARLCASWLVSWPSKMKVQCWKCAEVAVISFTMLAYVPPHLSDSGFWQILEVWTLGCARRSFPYQLTSRRLAMNLS